MLNVYIYNNTQEMMIYDLSSTVTEKLVLYMFVDVDEEPLAKTWLSDEAKRYKISSNIKVLKKQ